MKKIFLSLVIMGGLLLSAEAASVKNISYDNIKENSKVSYNAELDKWSDNVSRKETDYYKKTISVGSGNYSEFLKTDETLAFSTGCNYEFIKNGDLIGYSNQDLKFYDFAIIDGELTQRELTKDEVQNLFPDFEILLISEFSPNTNSLKIKKHGHNSKYIILNDTDDNFYHYSFTSGNAKFNTYQLAGFIEVTKKGMIQFSHFGDNTKENPWFILLVR